MSARIAPEPIAATAAVFADYRPAVVTGAVQESAATSNGGDATKAQANLSSGVKTPESDRALELPTEEVALSVQPPPSPEPSGAAYVRAVISGALSPRPTSAQELFARVGTGWVPPESEYRLTDKTI